LVVDHIARQNGVTVKKKLYEALVGECSIDGKKIFLAKPQTYMNRSGESVRELLREYRATAEDLVVVYDDLDLAFGRIRVRLKGSAAGHRGLSSILESLAGASFCRVRIGIGRPPEGMDATDYVLEPFSSEERTELDAVTERASEAVITLLHDGVEKAMERFNRAT
jgi:PTH1 family peptidyl-tRNA hydrolase